MKKIGPLFILLLLCACLALLMWMCVKFLQERKRTDGITSSKKRFELPEDLPAGDTAYIPFYPENELHRRLHYVFSYSEKERLANWVAYELTPDELVRTTKRSGRFVKDKAIKNGVHSDEYKHSGYDRGHLAPAADMAFSEEAMKESFLMSNVAPQLPYFNRGIWNSLENQVRSWVSSDGAIYVVTGGVWNDRSNRLAEHSIPIPDYYYKVLFDTNRSSKGMIVFLIPHSDTRHSIFDYVITVDSLEKVTAIDFFPQLPDSLEEALESEVRKSLWRDFCL